MSCKHLNTCDSFLLMKEDLQDNYISNVKYEYNVDTLMYYREMKSLDSMIIHYCDCNTKVIIDK